MAFSSEVVIESVKGSIASFALDSYTVLTIDETVLNKATADSIAQVYWHMAYDPIGDQMVQWSSRDNPMPDPFFGGVPIMTSPVYLCDHTELLGAVVFAVTLE
jgi:hypothetical protein